MSKLSEFFGGGGGGGSTGVGGIPVEILGVSGSGGSGRLAYGTYPCTVSNVGGAGAIMHATNYSVEPGVTVPITIGAGGAAGAACPPGPQPNSPPGLIGGTTCFNYPQLPICVIGGGGGEGIGGAPSPTCLEGGNGGGLRFQPANTPCCRSINTGDNVACGRYNTSINRVCYTISCKCPGPAPTVCSYQTNLYTDTSAKGITTPWGTLHGFPGGYSYRIGTDIPSAGRNGVISQAGLSGGNAPITGASQKDSTVQPRADAYRSDITGSCVEYNTPGTFGAPGELPTTPTANCSGNPGGLIIKWAAVWGASPSFPGATNISPQTPGYYTYCFTSSGSITLP